MTDAALNMQIVTNNPNIQNTPETLCGVVMVEGSPLDVLDKTEELLQQSWRLRSTPLPPNVPIMRGPYRSLVIERADKQYDVTGIQAIEKARDRYEIERRRGCPGKAEDFAAIDETMLQRTLRDISLLKTA